MIARSFHRKLNRPCHPSSQIWLFGMQAFVHVRNLCTKFQVKTPSHYRYLVPGPFLTFSLSGMVEICYWASFYPYPHRNCVYNVYTKVVLDVFNWYLQNVYKMYTKCIPHFDKLCIHLIYKIKRTIAAKFCTRNVYKSLSKCEIHFVYILYTSILIYKKCIS